MIVLLLLLIGDPGCVRPALDDLREEVPQGSPEAVTSLSLSLYIYICIWYRCMYY